MAEFAESVLQSTVPEVEEMERLGLLTSKEIRALIKKRREMEYRLARISKNKDDFINSINYEKKLLHLLKLRRKDIRVHEKFKEIEGAINIRVMKRCRFMTRYWPHHLDTWAVRIQFAQAIGWKAEVTIAYAEQIRHHGQRESIYISWARYEIEKRDNFDVARKILLSKAPLYHKKSPLIKRELFRLELLYVESLMKRKAEDKSITEVIEENREKVLQCAIPRAIFKDAVQVILDPQLYLDMYLIADKYSFARDLREEIYKDLLEVFPNSECLWKLKALRIAQGTESVGKEEEGVEKKPVRRMLGMDRLNAIIGVFDGAVNAVGPTFVVPYIEELIAMLHECWSDIKMQKFVMDKILSLCDAYKSTLEPIHFFMKYCLLTNQSKVTNDHLKVLQEALISYPAAVPLQLEAFNVMLGLELSDEGKLKEFNKIVTLSGIIGLQIWDALLESLSDKKLKLKLYKSALYHTNETIRKGVRIQYLKHLCSLKGLNLARKLYKDIGMKPPFLARLHATMVLAELSRKNVSTEHIRSAFNNAIHQHGATHPGVWLSLIHFEKTLGDPLKAGGLYTRAEKELEAEHADTFRQLNLIIRDLQSKKGQEQALDSNNVWVSGKSTESADEEQQAALVKLFDEELTITYSVDQERKEFFVRIKDMKKLLGKGNPEAPKEDGSEWEDVLEHLLGFRLTLSIHQVTISEKPSSIEEEIVFELTNPQKQKIYELSDHLDPGTEEETKKSKSDELEKILQSSLTLKPEFMKQTQIAPYFVQKRTAKALRKLERMKTKGPGWFDMKAPEMTEEMSRDMQILQMRPVLDKKRPFKNKDLKVMPKYFQMGKIIESPLDFYSSRLPKKSRKRTMAEEIMNDEEALRYQKRKFKEIIVQRVSESRKKHAKKDKFKKGKPRKKVAV